MNTIGNYFCKSDNDGISLKNNIVKGKKFRFTFLSDRLIRLEYSPTGSFEDRISQRVIFRNFSEVKYTKTFLKRVYLVLYK